MAMTANAKTPRIKNSLELMSFRDLTASL